MRWLTLCTELCAAVGVEQLSRLALVQLGQRLQASLVQGLHQPLLSPVPGLLLPPPLAPPVPPIPVHVQTAALIIIRHQPPTPHPLPPLLLLPLLSLLPLPHHPPILIVHVHPPVLHGHSEEGQQAIPHLPLLRSQAAHAQRFGASVEGLMGDESGPAAVDGGQQGEVVAEEGRGAQQVDRAVQGQGLRGAAER